MNSATLEKISVQKICQELARLQADTFLLYVKTQNFHWNLVDPRFSALHKFFEEQYEELADAIDMIAERIRAVGGKSLGSMQEYLEFTGLEESKDTLSGDEMLKALLKDHEAIVQWLRRAIDQTAEWGDQGSSDLCINRLRAHEKMAWMIKSHLRS